MPCTRARSSHTRQRTSPYDEPSAARRPRRGRAHSSAPRGRRDPSLQSTLFIAAPQGHSGRNHSVWGTRAATCHRKRHPPSCVLRRGSSSRQFSPGSSADRFATPDPLPPTPRSRILQPPNNLRSGSCTYSCIRARFGARGPRPPPQTLEGRGKAMLWRLLCRPESGRVEARRRGFGSAP
jgi:hypothetical protein